MYRRIAAAAGLSLGLFACGPSGGGTPPAPTATARPTTAPGGPTELNFTVSTTGAVTESGTFQFAAFPNGTSAPCANFTAAASQFYVSVQGTVASQLFAFQIAIIPYTGPGTYMTSTSVPVGVGFGTGSSAGAYGAPIGPNGPHQFTLTTDANGGGTFDFTNWPNQINGQPGPKLLSGTIRWTCSLT